MTLVLIGKDLVLEGSSTKIEDKRVPGILSLFYLYCVHMHIYTIYIYNDITSWWFQRSLVSHR